MPALKLLKMFWENTKQNSLTGAFVVQHKSLLELDGT